MYDVFFTFLLLSSSCINNTEISDNSPVNIYNSTVIINPRTEIANNTTNISNPPHPDGNEIVKSIIEIGGGILIAVIGFFTASRFCRRKLIHGLCLDGHIDDDTPNNGNSAAGTASTHPHPPVAHPLQLMIRRIYSGDEYMSDIYGNGDNANDRENGRFLECLSFLSFPIQYLYILIENVNPYSDTTEKRHKPKKSYDKDDTDGNSGSTNNNENIRWNVIGLKGMQKEDVKTKSLPASHLPADEIKKVNPYTDSVSDDEFVDDTTEKRHKPKKSDDEDDDDKKKKKGKKSDKSDIDGTSGSTNNNENIRRNVMGLEVMQEEDIKTKSLPASHLPADEIKKVNPYSDSVSDDEFVDDTTEKRHKPKKSDDEDDDDKKKKGKMKMKKGGKKSDKSDIDGTSGSTNNNENIRRNVMGLEVMQEEDIKTKSLPASHLPADEIKKVNPYTDSVSDDEFVDHTTEKRHKPKKSDDEDDDDKKKKGKMKMKMKMKMKKKGKKSDKSDIDGNSASDVKMKSGLFPLDPVASLALQVEAMKALADLLSPSNSNLGVSAVPEPLGTDPEPREP